jgi:DNA-binding NtrC family response regulator
MSFRALIIESDATARSLLREILFAEGWCVDEARSLEEALRFCDFKKWTLVFCAADALIGDEEADSLSVLIKLKSKLKDESHIVISGTNGNSESALEFIMSGASDYIRKPVSALEIKSKAREIMRRIHAVQAGTSHPPLIIHPEIKEKSSSRIEIIGESPPLIEVFKTVAQALRKERDKFLAGKSVPGRELRPASFFITGETGTGKELFARLIHQHSAFDGGQFVAINCGTLPAELAESELFGYAPGAFTGATKPQRGLWEIADGGTLLLDEITECSIALQTKLLRVLQEGTIKRLGSLSWRKVNVQVIAASNRNLKEEIAAGRFRQDLYHRLALYRLQLPPLRERQEDIPPLVAYFASRYASRTVEFSQGVLQLLKEYQWPGNVRELENLVRAVVMQSADGKILEVDVLSQLNIWEKHRKPESPPFCHHSELQEIASLETSSLEARVKKLKFKIVRETLSRYSGNVTRAASALGITRPTLYKLLQEMNRENS